MKRVILFLMGVLMLGGMAFAQTLGETEVVSEGTQLVIDLGSFTGIVALVSAVVTQIAKLSDAVNASRLAKIGISCAVGMIVCVLAWLLKITPLLDGYAWWGVLIYGIAAGLSGCGFYDVVKAIADLFKPAKQE